MSRKFLHVSNFLHLFSLWRGPPRKHPLDIPMPNLVADSQSSSRGFSSTAHQFTQPFLRQLFSHPLTRKAFSLKTKPTTRTEVRRSPFPRTPVSLCAPRHGQLDFLPHAGCRKSWGTRPFLPGPNQTSKEKSLTSICKSPFNADLHERTLQNNLLSLLLISGFFLFYKH